MGVNSDAIEVNEHRDAGGGGGGVTVDWSQVRSSSSSSSSSSHHDCSIPVIMDSSDGNGDAADDLQLKLQRTGYDDDDGDDEEDYDRENFNSLDYDDIEALDLIEPADVDIVIGQEEGQEEGDDEEMDGLDGDRDGQQSSFLHWRVVNQCIRFSEEELRYSVLALVEWAQLLLKGPRSDEKSYCSIVLPLLHVWSSASKHRSGMMMMSRKISNKDSSLLSMYQLAVSVEADDDCYSMPMGWLDKSHCSYSRLVAAMAARVNIEQIVQRDTLLSMTHTLSGILKEVQRSEGIDCSRHLQVIDACTKKAVQRLHYSSGRTRTSKVVYVSYDQPIGDDDVVVDDNDEEKVEGDEDIQPIAAATGFRDTSDLLPPSKRGKARQNASSSSSTSAPVVIAWNRFKRVSSLHEDPLVTAMREYSEAAALLTKKLLGSDPTSIHTANELFKEVMRQLNPYETVYAVEYHLPINRMYALHPKTAIACLFAAHDYAVLRKHSEALEKYLEAYCVDGKQPLTCLCIATYLTTTSCRIRGMIP